MKATRRTMRNDRILTRLETAPCRGGGILDRRLYHGSGCLTLLAQRHNIYSMPRPDSAEPQESLWLQALSTQSGAAAG